MKERPILMSAPMVKALLAGTKTQTRRLVKPQMGTHGWFPAPPIVGRRSNAKHYASEQHMRKGLPLDFCPFGQVRDRLWVRETLRVVAAGVEYVADESLAVELLSTSTDDRMVEFWNHYAHEDGPDVHPTTVPAIYMPRWASRITLEITEVRVERLWEISEADAKAEGAVFHDGHGVGHSGWRHDPNHGYVYDTARNSFAALWGSINEKRAPWSSNPWVWALSFRVIR